MATENRLRWTRTVVVEGPASWVLATHDKSLTILVEHAGVDDVAGPVWVGGIRQTEERLELATVVAPTVWTPVAPPPVRIASGQTRGHIEAVPLRQGGA